MKLQFGLIVFIALVVYEVQAGFVTWKECFHGLVAETSDPSSRYVTCDSWCQANYGKSGSCTTGLRSVCSCG